MFMKVQYALNLVVMENCFVFSKLPKVLGKKWKLTEHLTGLEPVTSTTPVALFLTELKMLSQHKSPIHTGNIAL